MNYPGLSAEVMHARPRSEQELEALFEGGWPAFIEADPLAAQYLPHVRERFADLEIVLVDDDGLLIAACWGVPIQWDGSPATVPAGYSTSLQRAIDDDDRHVLTDTLVICAAQVRPSHTGAGIAAQTLTALLDVARQRKLTRAIAPLRPSAKVKYPLSPIAQYATWTRPDGAALDPWLRTHQRMGANVIATSPRSQTFTGSTAQWEHWSGLVLPVTGSYIVTDGLATLELDHEADIGVLDEPCIWVQHR